MNGRLEKPIRRLLSFVLAVCLMAATIVSVPLTAFAAAVMSYEDFAYGGSADGAALYTIPSAIVSDTGKGWFSGYCSDKQAATVITNSCVAAITTVDGYRGVKLTDGVSAAANYIYRKLATTNAYNYLSENIDAVYYISWKQRVDAATNASGNNQSLSFINGGNGTVLLDAGFVYNSTTQGFNFYARGADSSTNIGNYVYDVSTTLVPGKTYNILLKVSTKQASAAGNDVLYAKVWPADQPEPLNWSITVPHNNTNQLSVVRFSGLGVTKPFYADFSFSAYSGLAATDDGTKCEMAESSYNAAYTNFGSGTLSASDISTLQTNIGTISSAGKAKTFLQNRCDTLKANADAAGLTWTSFAPSLDQVNITESFAVPVMTAGDFGSSITWNSSDSAIAVDASGNATVTRPGKGQPDKNVTLTAKVGSSTAYANKTFTVTVKAIPSPAYDDAQILLSNMGGSLILTPTADISLPTIGVHTTIDWQISPGQSFLTLDGANHLARVILPTAKQGDQQVTLTATLANTADGTDTAQDIFTVKLPSASGNVAQDAFDYGGSDGTTLNTIEAANSAEAANGWSTGWTSDSTFTTPVSDDYVMQTDTTGKVIQYTAPTDTDNAVIYRGLTGSINMDADRDYYIRWNEYQDANAQAPAAGSLVSKVDLLGASKAIAFGLGGNNAGSTTVYPLIKMGTAKTKTSVPLTLGTTYTFLVKISAKADPSANDKIYLKVFPAGTSEPMAWTADSDSLSASTPVNGMVNSMDLYGSLNKAECVVKFGDLSIDSCNSAEIVAVTAAENALSTAVSSVSTANTNAAVQVINNLPDGIAKVSLINRLNQIAVAGTFVSSPVYKSGSTVLSQLQAGTVNCQVTVINNNDGPISAKLVLALYNGDTLESLQMEPNSNITLPAATSKVFNVGISVPSTTNYKVKAFLWDNLNSMQPLMDVSTIDSTAIY